MVAAGTLILQYDARLLLEYREVISRPKFQFDPDDIDVLLTFISHYCQLILASPLEQRLPDPDDEPFLEISIAGRAACLVTGNKSHYPRQARQGMEVVSPSDFIDFYRRNRKDTEDR